MGDVLPQSHWASYALGLGERVRAIRLMRGLSQSRLAELSGVSRSLISNLERNVYNLSLIYISSPRDVEESRMPSSA